MLTQHSSYCSFFSFFLSWQRTYICLLHTVHRNCKSQKCCNSEFTKVILYLIQIVIICFILMAYLLSECYSLTQCIWQQSVGLLMKTHEIVAMGHTKSEIISSSFWFTFFPCVLLCFSVEPMRTPKRLKIAETRSRLIAVDWESLGYNITRCHTFNVTICYHYMSANNRSKADCLDMDPKGKTQFNYYYRLYYCYLYCCFTVIEYCSHKCI